MVKFKLGENKMTNRNRPTENKKRGLLTIGLMMAVLVMVALLAACQPAAQPAAQAADQSAQPQRFGGNGQRPNFQMTPAPELPTTASAVTGSLIKIDGNTLTVQAGALGANFGQGNGTPRPRPTSNGTPRPRPTQAPARTIQVIVNGDTQYYQDVTFANLNGQPPSGAIQQKVEKGSLAALSDNERITVWGDQNGDQITAKVIVYSQSRGGGPQQPPQG
jgi:hypothetical protein